MSIPPLFLGKKTFKLNVTPTHTELEQRQKERLEWELREAARTGDVAKIRHLHTQNVNLNAPSEWGGTAVHHAVSAGQEEAIDTLATLGADMNARDTYGSAPMHYAAQEGRPGTILKLAERGAKLNACDCFEMTPLHRAANSNNQNVDAIKTLTDLNVSNICANALFFKF